MIRLSLIYLLISLCPIFVLSQGIEWKTFPEATQENPQNKEILVEVSTTWCQWCRLMEKKTLQSPKVVKYIQKRFIPVQYDAQQKENILFFGKEYTFNGYYNDLTYYLLPQRLEFPAHVILSPKGVVVKVIYGYLQENDFLKELKSSQ